MSQKFALIIGNSDYNDKNFSCLKTPDADVRGFAEVLSDPAMGGFDDVKTLLNESESNVRRETQRFFARRKLDDLLVLYFSGHGVLDDQGRLYLAVKDTEYELWGASAIPATFITDNMDNSRSKRQVLILDCCHSGAFARGSKAVTGAKALTEATFEGKGYGKVVLTASDTTQYAWENDEVIGQSENSTFTHFLIDGLKNGVADTNNDGEITLDELYEHVYKNLISTTSRQTPQKWAYNQEGDIVIAANQFTQINPTQLPDDVVELLEHINPLVREGGVREMERLLKSKKVGLSLAARAELERTAAEDDSRKVANIASEILERNPVDSGKPPGIGVDPQQIRIAELTAEADAATEKQDWKLAIEKLTELFALQPDNEDFKSKLKDAVERLGLEPDRNDIRSKIEYLYLAADSAINARNWEIAIERLEALLELDQGHQEAAAKLQDAREEFRQEKEEKQKRNRIAELDSEARAAESNEEWAVAIKSLQESLSLDSNQPEVKKRIEFAQEQLRLTKIYDDGQRAYDLEDWAKALRCFKRVQTQKPDYRDVSARIAEINEILAKSVVTKPSDPVLTGTSTPNVPIEPVVNPNDNFPFTPIEKKRTLWPYFAGAGALLIIIIIVIATNSGTSSLPPNPSPQSTPQPAGTPTPSLQSKPTNAPEERLDVTGMWAVNLKSFDGLKGKFYLSLSQNGDKLTVRSSDNTASSTEDSVPQPDGNISGNNITFYIEGSFGGTTTRLTYGGTVDGNTMKGETSDGGTWTAKRQ